MCTVSRHVQMSPKLEVCEYPADAKAVVTQQWVLPWTELHCLVFKVFSVERDCRPVASPAVTYQSRSLIKQNL